MNKKGYAITGLLYTIMMIFIVFTMMILFNLQNKKTILDELKADTVLALDDDASISAILDRLEVLENENKEILNKTYPVGSIYVTTTNKNPKETIGGTWVSWGSGRVPVGVDASQTEFNTVEKTGGSKTHKLTIDEMPSHTHIQTGHKHSFNSTTSSAGAHTHTFEAGGFAMVVHANSSHTNMSFENGFNYIPSGGWFIKIHKNVSNIASSGAHTHTVSGDTSTTTAINQNTGGGQAHNNLQPYITAYMWKRTA